MSSTPRSTRPTPTAAGSGAESALRRDARAILDAAVAAVEPKALVAAALSEGPRLAGASAARGTVRLAAIGKAAGAMSRGAVEALGDRLAGGVVIVPAGATASVPGIFEVYGGGHPLPTPEGVAGARAVQAMARDLGVDDTLLVLISGGGSALMTLPPAGIELDELQRTTTLLLRSGATIGELNTVRKHLDELKGGRLARAAGPAQVEALVLSDVVGDPLDVIASGPTSPDPTTFADAVAVLQNRGVWPETPAAVRAHLEAGHRGEVRESPVVGDPCFRRCRVRIVGNNRLAVDAAIEVARAHGFAPLLLTTTLGGEAREIGGVLAALAREVRASGRPISPPACILAAGETTVTVVGQGRGGRNQELVLGAVDGLAGMTGTLLSSFGTDGIDGPTDAAGAWADGGSRARADDLGLDVGRYLADNDAYGFFDRLGDLVRTGPTGTNVMDLAVVLVG